MRLLGLVFPRPVGSSWTRDQTCVSCIGRWMTRLPFSFYSRTFFPIPAVLGGPMVFSSQARLPPFIAYSLLLFAQPQNPVLLEPSPSTGFVGRVPDRVLRPGFIPDSAPGELCATGQTTSEPQPPAPQPSRGEGKLLASVSCQLLRIILLQFGGKRGHSPNRSKWAGNVASSSLTQPLLTENE